MSAAVQFQKAVRRQVKLKIGVQGPSGAGKTLGALTLATALAPNGRVAVIDTEHGSAALYSDRLGFDTLELEAPYTSARYIEALDAAVAAGYEVVVIDSVSHQWNGSGGILNRKEQLDARGGNGYTNWAKFTKEHTEFQERVLAAPVHVVSTLRAKQDYVLEDKNGKTAPKKVGLAAVQREGFEYEYSIVFEVQMDHRAVASKDRTGLFADEIVDLCNADVAKRLKAWLASAAAAIAPAPPPELAVSDRVLPVLRDFPTLTGMRVGDLTDGSLDALADYTALKQGDGWARLATTLEGERAVRAERAALRED